MPITGCTIQTIFPSDNPNEGRVKINQNFQCLTNNLFPSSGITSNPGNRWYIPSGETVTIASTYQGFIYGDLVVDGTLNLEDDSQIVILNGTLINTGGTINASSGATIYVTDTPDIYMTGGSYSSGTITFSVSNGETFEVTGLPTGSTLFFNSFENFPTGGTNNAIYVDDTNNVGYLWNSTLSAYTNIAGTENLDEIPLTFAQAATASALGGNPFYTNGLSGVGATLTATTVGVLADNTGTGRIDLSYIPQVGDVILVKNQTPALQNGLYTIDDTGSLTTTYKLTRVSGFDESSELFPLQVNVLGGNNNALKYFIQSTINPVIGTSGLVFSVSSLQPVTSQIAFVDTATSAPLPSCTYISGTTYSTLPGAGAVLSATTVGALGFINGLSATTNSNIVNGFTRVLVKDQVNPAHNGDYSVTNAGSPTTKWVLTRRNDWGGAFSRYTRYFLVSNNGSTKAGKYYFTTPNNPPLANSGVNGIGVAPINIVEYGGVGGTTFTGGTVSGATTFTAGLSATSISATTYYGLPISGSSSQVAYFNSNSGLTGSTNFLYSGNTLIVRATGSTNTPIFVARDSASAADIFSVNGDGILYKPHSSSNDDTERDIFISQMSDGRNKIRLFTKGSVNLSSAIGISFQNDALGTQKSTYSLTGAKVANLSSFEDASSRSVFYVGGSDVTQISYFSLKDYANSNTNIYIPRSGTIILNPDNQSASIRGLTLFGGTLGTTADRVISIGSGTAPTTSTADNFQLWSDDIIGGNAAPHFRTENGDVVKLYKHSAVTTVQGVANALTTIGLLSSSTISTTNIYNSDGVLTGPRVVNLSASPLTFVTNSTSANRIALYGSGNTSLSRTFFEMGQRTRLSTIEGFSSSVFLTAFAPNYSDTSWGSFYSASSMLASYHEDPPNTGGIGNMFFDLTHFGGSVVNKYFAWHAAPIQTARGLSTEMMRLHILGDGNGNLGINVKGVPRERLHVSGNTLMDGSLTARTATISGTGQNILTVIGSGNASPLFSVQGAAGRVLSVIDNANSSSFSMIVSGNTSFEGSLTARTATISGSGQNILTVIGSGNTSPLFSVQGSYGELFSVTDSLSGSLFSVNDISGLPILEAFDDNTILMGSFLAPSLNTTVKTFAGIGDTNIYSLVASAYTGAFFEYTAINSGGTRAGSIMSVWSGSSITWTETPTASIGLTTGITFNMTLGTTATLRASGTTAGWTVKTIVRSI